MSCGSRCCFHLPIDPREAIEQRRVGAARALSCVSRTVVRVAGQWNRDQPTVLLLGEGDPVALRGSSQLTLAVAQHLRVHPVEDEAEGPLVRTVAYLLAVGDASGRELFAYHWHPSGPSRVTGPHLHVHAEIQIGPGWLPKVHLPTGVVELQDVLHTLIEELGVEPLRDDWQAVLDSTRP